MTELTTEERAILTTRLAEAEDALHKLRLGQTARTYVDQNGERVEFNAANADRLRGYIIEMKSALGLPMGIVGPLNVWVL